VEIFLELGCFGDVGVVDQLKRLHWLNFSIEVAGTHLLCRSQQVLCRVDAIFGTPLSFWSLGQ